MLHEILSAALPDQAWECERCGAEEVCRVVDVEHPDRHSAIGERDIVPHLICGGADCYRAVERIAEREAGKIIDVSAYRPTSAQVA